MRTSWASTLVNTVLTLLPLAIGLGPLGVLIMLIRNPVTYVTDAGVMRERVFSPGMVSIPWAEVAHVYCRPQKNGDVRAISVIAEDGRIVSFGNMGGVDFASLLGTVAESIKAPRRA